MIHFSKVLNGAQKYIDNEIAAQFKGSLKAWGISAAAGIVQARAGQMFQALTQIPALKVMGLIDGEMVDEELIYAQLLDAARKGSATVNIPLLGPVTFGEHDVETLHRYIIGG